MDLEESDTDEQQSLYVRGLSQDQCTAGVLVIYRKIIDTEAEHKRLEENKRTAEIRKHEEVVRQVVNKSPEQFLNDSIDSRIAMSKAAPKPKKETRKKQNDRGALQVHVDHTGVAVQALSGMMDQSIVSDYVAVRPNESKGATGFGKTNNSKGYCKKKKEKENVCLPAKAREKERAVARTKAHNLQTDLCQKTMLPLARGAKANPRARVCNSRKAREKARKEVAKTPGLAAVAEDGNEKFVVFRTFCFFILATSQRYAAF